MKLRKKAGSRFQFDALLHSLSHLFGIIVEQVGQFQVVISAGFFFLNTCRQSGVRQQYPDGQGSHSSSTPLVLHLDRDERICRGKEKTERKRSAFHKVLVS